MPVFISHKDSDTTAAIRAKMYLENKNVKCYVDVFDESLGKTDDITNRITTVIGNCTHLIAMMSNATEKSWWVPFEIGEATFGARRICSYDLGCTYAFPDYLKKWPIMKTTAHLDLFAVAYHGESDRVKNLSKSAVELPLTTRSQAEDFHRDLKIKIARGY